MTHYLEFCETRNRDPGGCVAFSEYCEEYGYFFGTNSETEGESDASIEGTEEQKSDHKRKRIARKFVTARARPKARPVAPVIGRLTEANLEAFDFRIPYAEDVVKRFKARGDSISPQSSNNRRLESLPSMPASTDSSAPPRPPKEPLFRDDPDEERFANRERDWTEFYRRHEARLTHAFHEFEHHLRSEPKQDVFQTPRRCILLENIICARMRECLETLRIVCDGVLTKIPEYNTRLESRQE